MKSKLFSLLLVTLSTASTCHREGPDCHHNIIFKNDSKGTIIYALPFTDLSGCILENRFKAEPGEEFALDLPRYCWEQELAKGKTAELYVIDPAKFNAGFHFYDCDSIQIKNKVLKHYELTLDDLKRNNFTITYEN
ncbi:hypothetical protein J2Y45_004695 [Dyadobacter sp. BE34]|uniref:Lipoprotein n=1 Tax=Dyadobacter fermentans TaxID=94254 RepID=A0ABU1R286_9BACT|nr:MULTISPECIES: hypothetical protein [Dyadobacter]MDR6807495.1 hypothetical protein [Dyadobacter fermentans]MDR7045236.1 hypothetical protein [Dyadobacter sp. BE242]MDR7199549.1 hypothetical protein [Dyadobacter sp. BE34]MDR7217992.1 hypothetical protein [Dyadobacter sp. BE31]MDR7265440.1 hypothetical protein [Dyadobacter sp. BE32]